MWVFCLPLLTAGYTCGDAKTTSFAKGDEVPVCIHFSPTYKKVLFLPRLDVYSGVEAKGAYSYFSALTTHRVLLSDNQTDSNTTTPTNNTNTDTPSALYTDISIAVQVAGSMLTTWVPYIIPTLVAPVFSVVVDVSDGDIDSIEWDNSCSVCDTECITSGKEEICAQESCTNETSSDCDPKIYVSWLGTDKNGLNLESSAYRISAFRKFSLYDSYNSANKDF